MQIPETAFTTDYADSTDKKHYFFLIHAIGVIRGYNSLKS
jgi:hypothetical protein